MELKKLPDSTLILIFGIISIVTCCCYGIVGLIFGIVALVLANRSLKLYAENPEQYEDVQTVNIGRILAIIGIALNAIYLCMILWVKSVFGWESLFMDIENMRELIDQQTIL